MSYTQLGTYIDGKWNHGNGGGGEDVINPATQKPLGICRTPAKRSRRGTRGRRKGLQAVEDQVGL